MNCKQIKDTVRIDAHLAKMGLHPTKETAKSLWYLSPITGETNASFSVSRDGRMFHDWSSGARGTIIDLYRVLHPGSSVHDAIIGLSDECNLYSSTVLNVPRTHVNITYKTGLVVLNSYREICRTLQGYAFGRGITRDVLARYCVEVTYSNAGRSWYGLGFQNDKGGFEIRSHYFKGGSSPKAITTIGTPRACPYLVFEGFFDFLSAVQLGWFRPEAHNAVVLNSTAMAEDGIAALQCATRIISLLDNDDSGMATFKRIAASFPEAESYSFSFSPAKDLNERLAQLKKMNYSKIRTGTKAIEY